MTRITLVLILALAAGCSTVPIAQPEAVNYVPPSGQPNDAQTSAFHTQRSRSIISLTTTSHVIESNLTDPGRPTVTVYAPEIGKRVKRQLEKRALQDTREVPLSGRPGQVIELASLHTFVYGPEAPNVGQELEPRGTFTPHLTVDGHVHIHAQLRNSAFMRWTKEDSFPWSKKVPDFEHQELDQKVSVPGGAFMLMGPFLETDPDSVDSKSPSAVRPEATGRQRYLLAEIGIIPL